MVFPAPSPCRCILVLLLTCGCFHEEKAALGWFWSLSCDGLLCSQHCMIPSESRLRGAVTILGAPWSRGLALSGERHRVMLWVVPALFSQEPKHLNKAVVPRGKTSRGGARISRPGG